MADRKFLALDDTGKHKIEKEAINVSAGAGDAEKIIATDDEGKIDPSFLPESEFLVREASEDLDQWDWVNIWDDGGTAKARKADASAFGTRAMGYIRNNYLTAENAEIFAEGIMPGFVGLTIGAPVFLSLVSGETTQVPPTATGEIWQKVGEAVSATEIRVEIGEAIVRA